MQGRMRDRSADANVVHLSTPRRSLRAVAPAGGGGCRARPCDRVRHGRACDPRARGGVREAAAIPDAEPPEWLGRLDAAPVVYLTMGTVWNRDLSVFGAVIDAVRGEHATLIVTVGNANDPADLGPQPPNILVHRYVPQAFVLSRCDAVVAHGGAGTTLGALASGVPLLLLPNGADQYANADRIVAAGAGVRILKPEISPRAIADALRELLESPSYRAAARRIQAEIQSMPLADDAVRRIEKLVNRSACVG